MTSKVLLPHKVPEMLHLIKHLNNQNIYLFTTTNILFSDFPAEPPHPPSYAMYQEKLKRKNTFTVFMKSTKALLMNKSFFIHSVSYGCNVGIFSVISTLLNQSIMNYFEVIPKNIFETNKIEF